MIHSTEAWLTQTAWALRVIYVLAKGMSILVPVAGFLLIGVVFFRFSAGKHAGTFSLKAALKYLFPADLYRNRSSKIDAWVVPLTIAFPIAVSALGLGVLLLSGKSFQALLLRNFGTSPVTVPDGWVGIALQFAIIFLAADFAYYVYHYLFHKVPFLWRLHRAHHSAEVLTPLAKWRFNPAETLFELAFEGPFSGLLAGTLMYLCGMKISATATALVVAMNLAFQTTFYFRHSHIWISYGKILNHIFYSPCMHVIHHSALPQHRDKNLGSVLAFWDWLFGTLCVPDSREEFPLGISAEELGARNPHSTMRQFLLEPLTTAAKSLCGLMRGSRGTGIANLPS